MHRPTPEEIRQEVEEQLMLLELDLEDNRDDDDAFDDEEAADIFKPENDEEFLFNE
ncbi:MAG: hypothetical protein M0Z66_02165 [Thermaerobacter sp.]|nr:hypothetical protein [Thermaerobacter sp.]